ncbi:hypothetical protein BDZ97DRAFT_1813076 [Flammula alnicola]|nr:hypothetical protein BDZ97DRAFT_1813076 [Flammula alnicola]
MMRIDAVLHVNDAKSQLGSIFHSSIFCELLSCTPYGPILSYDSEATPNLSIHHSSCSERASKVHAGSGRMHTYLIVYKIPYNQSYKVYPPLSLSQLYILPAHQSTSSILASPNSSRTFPATHMYQAITKAAVFSPGVCPSKSDTLSFLANALHLCIKICVYYVTPCTAKQSQARTHISFVLCTTRSASNMSNFCHLRMPIVRNIHITSNADHSFRYAICG